jgi:phosphoglycolate phosphatase
VIFNGDYLMVTICCGDVIFPDIAAVLFDKDGTLARSEGFLWKLATLRSHLITTQAPGIQSALLATFGVKGDRLNPAGLMAVGSRQENAIAVAGVVTATGWDWVAALELVQAAFLESDRSFAPDAQTPFNKAKETPLIAGTVELLQQLAQTSLKVGILSADTTENVNQFAQYNQLASFFQLQMGIDGFVGKSDPNFLQTACAQLGVTCPQTLVVGDSQADIELARSGLAKSVGVTWGWSTPVALKGADVVISDFNQFQVID